MIRKVPVVIAIVACIFHSCKSADSKPGNMAGEFCNCFKGIVAKLGKETKEMVMGTAYANNPKEYLRNCLDSLSEEKAQQVNREMQASRIRNQSRSNELS